MPTIQENVPLAPLATFHIGGPARYFARVQSVEDLKESLDFARGKHLAPLVLGGGSNVLIDDAGFDGVVIRIELGGVERAGDTLIASAGEHWDALVARSVEENLWGIENLSGIPGTVGGAVAGNIGAYGQALSQTLAWAEVFDTRTGEVKKMSNGECQFGYRDSFFSAQGRPALGRKHTDGQHIILRAAFALANEPRPELSYRDMAQQFGGTPAPALGAIRETVLAIRKGKFPDLSVEGTAGSFFKNPIVGAEGAAKLRARYPEMPLFAMPETSGIKVPLGWLLDHVLGLRGHAVGGARLFEKQALVIAARQGTPSHDVRALAAEVGKKVFETFAISVENEVQII